MKMPALEIAGFRGIERGTFVFPTHAALIGPNGCGKSTIVDALQKPPTGLMFRGREIEGVVLPFRGKR